MLETYRRQKNIKDVPHKCIPFRLLTKREQEVLQYTADGCSLEEIRRLMGISTKRVEAIRYQIGVIAITTEGAYYPNQARITILALIQDGITHGYLTHIPPEQPVQSLTPREIEIVGLVSQGKLQSEIAKEIYVSPKTVNGHMEHIYEKLHTRNFYQTVARFTYLRVRISTAQNTA